MSDDDAVDVEVESPDDAEADASAAATDESRDAARSNGTAAATAGGPSEDADEVDSDPLADAVAEHDEDLAEEVAALEDELAETRAELLEKEEEIDELTSKLARVRADFSNYKQRAKQKQEDIRERASESLVERITPVRNDLLRALDQEEGSDLRPGVESTLEKFDEVLADEGVEPIDPEPGSDVDPARHQVMLRVESDQPDGTVHEVYEPGYEMGDRVVNEAKVTVSADEE
ncbi:nucleotide exchange factor GrpE [Halorubrum sp. SD626R]|uniref:nucleotide exchange factor GrpE n=1 Tax=Halorubrum sp. SD626R TaxID=1419722 RepID=UPI0010F4ADB7|nr:nucleotide exchange factor GrpE [Halorubrum sp. SD626R]TKX78193.1 nucleotide exchange factor GrpE [Halorubrum sp. SD626R]